MYDFDRGLLYAVGIELFEEDGETKEYLVKVKDTGGHVHRIGIQFLHDLWKLYDREALLLLRKILELDMSIRIGYK